MRVMTSTIALLIAAASQCLLAQVAPTGSVPTGAWAVPAPPISPPPDVATVGVRTYPTPFRNELQRIIDPSLVTPIQSNGIQIIPTPLPPFATSLSSGWEFVSGRRFILRPRQLGADPLRSPLPSSMSAPDATGPVPVVSPSTLFGLWP
jgi:hypothetical protein